MIPSIPPDLEKSADIRFVIDKRLAWCCLPQSTIEAHGNWIADHSSKEAAKANGVVCFSTDETLIYEQFFADFGPLSMSCTVKYCRFVEQLLHDTAQEGVMLLHYCSDHPHRRTNAATLICLFALIVLGKSTHEAYAPFIGITPSFHPFRDAGFGLCSFPLLVIDVLKAVERATACGHFNYSCFDLARCETLERLENGDLSWIVPGKFVAFSGPHAQRRLISNGKRTLSAADCAHVLRRLGVTCVIRFNTKAYDKREFTTKGIRHVDLYFEDGSNPPPHILQRFLQTCEGHHGKGAIAVHCKAGLGRTGTTIAAYLMKHWMYTAHEVISWLRLCRPGCVIGPQQHFVADAELRLWQQGVNFRSQLKEPGSWTEFPPPRPRLCMYRLWGVVDDAGNLQPTHRHRNKEHTTRQSSADTASPSSAENRASAVPSPMEISLCRARPSTSVPYAVARGDGISAYRGPPMLARKTHALPHRRQTLPIRKDRRPSDSVAAVAGW